MYFFSISNWLFWKNFREEKDSRYKEQSVPLAYPLILKTNSCTLLLNTPIYCTLVLFAILHFMGICRSCYPTNRYMTKKRKFKGEWFTLQNISWDVFEIKRSSNWLLSFIQLNLIKMESSPPAGKLSQDCFKGQIESGVLSSAKDFISLLSPLRSLE